MANNNIKDFIKKWSGRGNEKQDTQQFWNDIIFDVLAAPKSTVINYEKPVVINGSQKYIDAYLPETRTLIEQKSLGIDLMKAEPQSDGMKLTPFEQGRRYGGYLPYDEQPRWIIESNFEEIRVHDMKKPGDPPEIIKLTEMDKDYTRLMFLVNSEDEHLKKEFEVSVKAGEIVGVLYDKLLAQYKDPSEHDLQSLNRVCVRIVFCLYAEDAGLFGNNTHAFHDYMSQFNGPARFRNGLKEFFSVLNQSYDERDPYLDPELAAFPYVNGGLFKDDNIALPFFTDEIVELILDKASSDFDWSDISPTIFGAIFESTLNPETRRSGGMHYTSIENIHKVIDPLFLDELKEELEAIKADSIDKRRNRKLKEYQNKLASLKFLDPACGSGNFLTESYMCLRRLENDLIADLNKGQQMMAFEGTLNPIKVSISQFYGIEINDFACATAQTAMWIAEAKMMKETEAIVMQDFDFFPLTNSANICEDNALKIDWANVVSLSNLDFIMGNPPFVGKKEQTKEQKQELITSFDRKISGIGNLDYVAGWYAKASKICSVYPVKCAFVSTNSITQGEQVSVLWNYLTEKSMHINFAYTTFQWDSEASIKAHVHCVIIGFSKFESTNPVLFNAYGSHSVHHINGYLMDAPSILIENRKTAISKDAPHINYGSFALDDGNYTISEKEYNEIIKRDPEVVHFMPLFIGANEMIKGIKRYCLWLYNASPTDIVKHGVILEKVEKVREWRSKSDRKNTVALANTPTLFAEIRQPKNRYLAIPTVCSERRRYLPMEFYNSDVIASNQIYVIDGASLYDFGILHSNVHMAWMRIVAGRMKSDYRYSSGIVYNNFPWPENDKSHKEMIEQTAQDILDARALFPDTPFSILYDQNAMPSELRKAIQANDRAVMQAYGFSLKMTEQECVAELMKMYQKLIEVQ